jgi:RimJ/RimL family protein N-acetyltransferase
MMPVAAQECRAAAMVFSTVDQLRDGRCVEIRALRPSDLPGLTAAMARMSETSMSRRFFSAKRHFSEKEISYFVHVDFVNHVALVAVADHGEGPIVAGARYVVVRPSSAELAFAVVDDCQGQGLGTLLLQHLVVMARRAALKEFVAEVLAENEPMLHVFERSGLRRTTRRDGGVVHVTMQL